MPKLPVLRIATDVSIQREFGVGCWAAYLKDEHSETKQVGRFRRGSISSGKGELQALANALALASRHYDLAKYRLEIYSDLVNILHYAKKQNGDPKRKAKPRYEFLNRYIHHYLVRAVSWQVFWVKGHQARAEVVGNIPLEMQSWCDRAARAEGRRLSAQIRKTRRLRAALTEVFGEGIIIIKNKPK